jgi:hypothetical protein
LILFRCVPEFWDFADVVSDESAVPIEPFLFGSIGVSSATGAGREVSEMLVWTATGGFFSMVLLGAAAKASKDPPTSMAPKIAAIRICFKLERTIITPFDFVFFIQYTIKIQQRPALVKDQLRNVR